MLTAALAHASTSVRQRRLIAASQVAALGTWFSASAVAPAVAAELGLTTGTSALLTSSVQIGFVVGAVSSAVLNLPDRLPLPTLYAVSALLAALSTAVFPALAHDGVAAVALRMLTGVFLAGVYPVGMKLTASWAPPEVRGRAFGLLVGALTLGSAVPHLIRVAEHLAWPAVMYGAAAIATAGAVLARLTIRVGPGYESRPQALQPSYAFRMFAERRPRLANLGYFGHMWELYAFWTWLPSFITASQLSRNGSADGRVSLLAFAAIGLAGVVGCLVGGWAADRVGRAPTAIAALAVSGSCCLLSPLFFGGTLAVLAVFLLVWGAAVIADSGVFSTALSESVDSHLAGTALTAQTAVGFSLTVATIHLVPVLAALGSWRTAFVVLAAGPLVGCLAMLRFHAIPTQRPVA
ncbi:MFS transporter [Nocardioides soli]|uniref:MFS transporter n=1 Tax=Nocardioides soli TaxID=1036020 RepID=UPI001C8417E0|nr:MFS transporter [Nocardioides soli]